MHIFGIDHLFVVREKSSVPSYDQVASSYTTVLALTPKRISVLWEHNPDLGKLCKLEK